MFCVSDHRWSCRDFVLFSVGWRQMLAGWAYAAEWILSPSSPGEPIAGLCRVCGLVICLHLISGIFLPFFFFFLALAAPAVFKDLIIEVPLWISKCLFHYQPIINRRHFIFPGKSRQCHRRIFSPLHFPPPTTVRLARREGRNLWMHSWLWLHKLGIGKRYGFISIPLTLKRNTY